MRLGAFLEEGSNGLAGRLSHKSLTTLSSDRGGGIGTNFAQVEGAVRACFSEVTFALSLERRVK